MISMEDESEFGYVFVAITLKTEKHPDFSDLIE